MELNTMEVKKAKRGDTAAFAGLYQQVYADLYRFALYTLKNKNDAEDAVSETVADAFASIGKLRKAEAFRGWIFRILYNNCKNKLKEYARKDEELPKDYREVAADEKIEDSVVMRTLFFELEEQERMIISMHLFAGYTSKEIGKILGMNENTVRMRKSQGFEKMRKFLK